MICDQHFLSSPHIWTIWFLCFCYPTATKLQAGWKGYSQKSKYQKLRKSGEKTFACSHPDVTIEVVYQVQQCLCVCLFIMYVIYLAAIAIQAWWRGILARRRAQQRRQAANTIRRYRPADGWGDNTWRFCQPFSFIHFFSIYPSWSHPQVHQRLHLPPQGALSRERVLPGLRALFLPHEAAQEPAQERLGQELADTSCCSHWGGDKSSCYTQTQTLSSTWSALDLSAFDLVFWSSWLCA